jgi:translation initiation factor 1
MSEICQTCGLPKDLCVCETIAKESQTIRVYVDKKRFGKKYTVIEGINQKEIDIKDLMKQLKSAFACGGTAKGGKIELQGEHVQKVKEKLIAMGFPAESIQVELLKNVGRNH